MKVITIHIAIVFILLLVIYGSAQEQVAQQEQPTQSFFFLTHSVMIDNTNNRVLIDGQNGTIISTGDLQYPRSAILDVVKINNTNAVIFSHGIYGSIGYTKIVTNEIQKTTANIGDKVVINGKNLTYTGLANGSLGQYHIYSIDGQNISVDTPVVLKIGNSVFMLQLKQNQLEISELQSPDVTMYNAIIIQTMLGILAVGTVYWATKTRPMLS